MIFDTECQGGWKVQGWNEVRVLGPDFGTHRKNKVLIY